MEENTTTTTTSTTPASGGGNTVMFVIGALVLAGILGYVIFSSNQENNEPEPTTVEETTTEETTPESTDEMETIPTDQELNLQLNNPETAGETINTTTPTANVTVVNLEAGFPYYKPNLITVKKGETVRIVMTSVDMQHDFVIDELGVKMPVTKAGETGTVEFVAGEAGSFEFYCSVGQHRQNGQFGTLVVQE